MESSAPDDMDLELTFPTDLRGIISLKTDEG